MSPLKECCGKYKYTQNELLAFVNLTIKQTNKQKNIYMHEFAQNMQGTQEYCHGFFGSTALLCLQRHHYKVGSSEPH